MSTSLSDIAIVRSGYTFRGAIQPDALGDAPVVQAKDINDASIDLASLPRIALKTVQAKPLTGGAVVLSARGTFRAAAISPDRPIIASSSLYTIQIIKNVITPEFLALYLNSPTAQTYFIQHATGAAIKTLLIDVLRGLPIPDVPMDRQQSCVALSQNIRRQRQVLESQVALNQTIINQLIIAASKGIHS